jgi:hypothetical protein
MNTSNLKNFAQTARTQLIEQVRVQLQRARSATGALRAGQAAALSNLEAQINKDGEQRVVEDAAYRWFNRFVALRFMDVNDYADLRAVSPNDGETLPDLLQLAKARQLPDDLKVDHQRINDLIDRVIPSPDPDAEVYRILLRAECNRRHAQLPFLFQRVDDFSELLLPADLLSQNSLLHQLRETLTPDVCKDNEEVIGWLYQFYISEKKDAVFAAKGKVKKEDIPAVTQLFTPRWIVEYMVQNTLGKLWLQSHPDSGLRAYMPYFLESAETLSPGPSPQERGDVGDRRRESTELPLSAQLSSPIPTTPEPPTTLFSPPIPTTPEPSPLSPGEGPGERVLSPQELTLADQACGSGHILLYAFELLTHIYEESGYTKAEIPHLILTHNLTGFEIDERAAQLAAFTLMMRARRYHRAALRKGSKPNIVRFQDLKIDDSRSVATLLANHGVHPTKELLHDLDLMTQATNLGSLIVPTATTEEIKAARTQVQSEVETSNDLFARNALRELDTALGQLVELGRTFWCVVDNPPYLGMSKANPALKKFVYSNYPDSKTDLFSAFISRGLISLVDRGVMGMVTMQAWMFLTSYEGLRKVLIEKNFIDSLLQVGYNSFPELNSKVAQAVSFTLWKEKNHRSTGVYFDLNDSPQSADKEVVFINSIKENKFFKKDQNNFKKIPGTPIGYKLGEKVIETFSNSTIQNAGVSGGRCKTHNDKKFTRFIWEVSKSRLEEYYQLYNNGGDATYWSRSIDEVVKWDKTSKEVYASHGGLTKSKFWKKYGITWNNISANFYPFRYKASNFEYSSAAPTIILEDEAHVYAALSVLNSSIAHEVLSTINPTLNSLVGDVMKVPFIEDLNGGLGELSKFCVLETQRINSLSETDLDFSKNQLMGQGVFDLRGTVEVECRKLSNSFISLHKSHEMSNDLVLKKFDLENELKKGIRFEKVTILQQELDRKSLAKLNTQLKRDPKTGLVTNYEELTLPFKRDIILQQFISYAVGCMMGRYSLDAEGLVLANAGDTLVQYAEKVGKEKEAWTFAPDEDGILPVLAGEYFPDDVVGEFRTFLRAAFGEAHFVENLAFVEECIGKDIRSYFVRDFYKDHVQRYKKRPIYWMFQSPGKHFRALVYLHRYRPDTVGRLLNDYLRPFIDRLNTERHNAQAVVDDAGSSASASNAARKTIETANAAIRDCEVYQKDLLELARQRIDLDLDDGVLVNYNKMGGAVEVIVGVNDAKGRKKVKGFDWVDWDWGA